MGCVEGRVRGCRQRESAVHENCVRRVRKRKRLSAQLLGVLPALDDLLARGADVHSKASQRA